MNSRKCYVCNIDVQRASYQKHLRSKKHLEKIREDDMIIPQWLFEEPIEIKNKKIYNPNSLKQLAIENFNLDNKKLNKELANRMLSPYYFTDNALQVGFNVKLDSHHINHANSKLTISPNYPEFGIEPRYINKILKEMATIYARLINQYKFKYQTVFSA